ncbi:MAG: HI1506-related protein [Methylotetracoccus sp.]
MIRITSQREGFRRAGRPHSATPTEYPDDAFTPEQMDALTAEPMLLVEFISDRSVSPAAAVAEVDAAEPVILEQDEAPAPEIQDEAEPEPEPEPAEAAPAPKRNRRKKGE